ncbi:MAG: hypothetical protein KGI94_05745 [Paracoccaceae bacterium]|nr:hypothetical protein [Paracoccaceae bacterium]
MFGRKALSKWMAIAAIALSTALTGAPMARAATYLMTFTSAGGDIGSLTVDLSGTTATAISGLIDGFSVTGLSTYAGADQQVLLNSTVNFTIAGLSFSASNGTNYNLTNYPNNTNHITNSVMDPNGYGTPTPYALTSFAISPAPAPTTSLASVSSVPLPGSAGFLLLALGLMGLVRLRRDNGPDLGPGLALTA